jgi:DNA-binding transcriptional MerR regulator
MVEQLDNLLTLSDTPRYNIKAVVQQTQVNISTLRAWEQRYGVPHPKRSEHGHRLYSQRDVAIIKWLKQCTEGGLAISQAIVMLRDADAHDCDDLSAPAPAASSGWAAMCEQLLDALADVNLRQAHLLVNTICTLFPIETVVLELFRPVLIEIGARWARGDVCVADERFATSFIRQRLLALLQLHAPFAQGPRLICACPPGEDHEIGLLTFALLMEQRGWEVVYLGQSVASDGLTPFLERLTPGLLCLSVSLVEHVAGLLETCRLAAELRSERLLVGYGGRVFDQYPEFVERIPATFLGNDLLEAVRRADAMGEQIDRERWLSAAVLSQRAQPMLLNLAVGS